MAHLLVKILAFYNEASVIINHAANKNIKLYLEIKNLNRYVLINLARRFSFKL